MTNSEKMKQVIKLIRKSPDWSPNHREFVLDDLKIGYYDTTDQDDYFVLKYDNIAVTHYNYGGCNIEFRDMNRAEYFSLSRWIDAIRYQINNALVQSLMNDDKQLPLAGIYEYAMGRKFLVETKGEQS